jgi:hypothetical protein
MDITRSELLSRGYSVRTHPSKEGMSYYKSLSGEEYEELVVDIFYNGSIFCRIDLFCDTFTAQRKLSMEDLDMLYYLLSGNVVNE